jgi:fibronectin type 3 domain-containing protein
MLEYRGGGLAAFRGALVAMCLALLSACGPGNDTASILPPVPAGLTATAGNAMVALAWATSNGASGYNVKRATTSGGPYTQLASVTSPEYTDSAVTNGTAYYYVVSSVDPAGESANSAQSSATPQVPSAPPSTPTKLTATAGNAQVSLTWTASAGATSYNLKRGTTSGGPYTQLAAVTSTAYTDSSVTNGTTYYYVVSAVDATGESANSAQSSATPQAPSAPPATPINLTATAGNAQVSLTWTASAGATSYNLKRATVSGGPFTQLAVVTSTAYIDSSVTNGTTYYYVVSAVDPAGESANSAQVSALPLSSYPVTGGTWIDVTPSGIDLTDLLDCGNFGAVTVQVDPMNPSNLYAEFNCQGIWKSTDYGVSWTGPINTGTNGTTIGDCSAGVAISPSSTASIPTIYESCIRGNGLGFWKSVDGGVDWTNYPIGATSRQDYYPPVIDPYDQNHLLMCGHEQGGNVIESVDGGQTWTNVSLDGGMAEPSSSCTINFINTGTAATTRGTWLWMAEVSGGVYGTWRTTNSGAAWVQVDKNEHTAGAGQIYQPDTGGVVFIAGQYSALGDGVLRSTDYGQTWTHEGIAGSETVVVGTPNNVYAMYGVPVGPGATTNPAFELSAQPGTGTWTQPGTPAGLTQGSAQIAVVNDGTHNILIGAMWNAGLWRYIEP